MKLAIVVSHPIQYYTPLFQELAARSGIDLMVYFCTDFGVRPSIDPSFGERITWDIPLLDGFASTFLKNYSPRPSPSTFWDVMNFGIIPAIFRNQYDAILIPGYSLFSYWLAFLAAWMSGTRILFRGETVLRPNRPWWVRTVKWIVLKPLFRHTAGVLSIGSKSEEFYLHYGVPKEKIFFTPYSIDNGRFMKESVMTTAEKNFRRAEEGIPEDIPLIIFVGKLIPKKRPTDLLQAFSLLEPELAALLFVGSGTERSVMEAVVKEKNIRNVFFTGFVNQRDLPKYYGMSDIFAFPSSAEEVSPLVVNEAMCARLPIVISDAVPSSRDFVADGVNGFIVPFRDIATFAEKLRLLSTEGERRVQMGKRSLEMIVLWNNGVCVEGIVRAVALAESHSTRQHPSV